MDRRVHFGRFEFDQEATFHENVGPKGIFDENTAMPYRNWQLALVVHTTRLQFGAKQELIGGLEETGPQSPVKLISAIDSNSRKLFEPRDIKSLWLRGFVRD